MNPFETTQLQNGYQFVNGVEMHAELGERFQIPHAAFKRHAGVGHYVEVRIDSPRFSAHPDAPESCDCPHCQEPMVKPVLCHEEPASFVDVPKQPVPSRGWGEQFWVQIIAREGNSVRGRIDNTLYESRLHGLNEGDEIVFLEDHLLAVHQCHNEDIFRRMDEAEWQDFRQWLMDEGLLGQND